MRELALMPDEVYLVEGLLDPVGPVVPLRAGPSGAQGRAWTPVTQPRLEGADDLFRVVSNGDLLVHHPYDSFETSIEAFIEQAAVDPAVLAIKLALYRTSEESPIVQALVRAAEAGKQVVALVELQARFDERANILQARTLEQAGVHVVYGIVGLKTHAKVCLVVRREDSGIRRYAHVGTGNYNPSTARLYEDVGLLSADPEVGADLSDLFNLLTGYSRQRLSPAPGRTATSSPADRADPRGSGGRRRLDRPEDEQPRGPGDDRCALRGFGGRRALDLFVRGICCLRPGVPGLSDTIRVRSIVGRYLEHSRIFRFGSRGRGFQHFIGSADLMPRNLDRRVEVTRRCSTRRCVHGSTRSSDPGWADDTLAWELGRRRRLDQGAHGARRERPGAAHADRGRSEGWILMGAIRDMPTHPPSLEEVRFRLDPLTRVDAGATARDLLRRALSLSTIRLVAKDPVVRGNRDPEGVHDARVAVRRLRSDLRTFRPMLHRQWTESIRTELEWLGGLLGQVRDAEVLQARLRGRIEAFADPELASGKVLLDDLGIREEEERRRLLDAMRSDRYGDLVERLVEGAQRPRTEGEMANDRPLPPGG